MPSTAQLERPEIGSAPGAAKGAHWRGHFFLFGATRVVSYGDAAGVALLLIFAVFEQCSLDRGDPHFHHAEKPVIADVRLSLLRSLAVVLRL